MQDVIPFKIERRKLEVGQWVDVKDPNGNWAEGQILNQYNDYSLVHLNGCPDKWNEWMSPNSERIMPFRTFTVQGQDSTYLSPFPKYERQMKGGVKFQGKMENFVNELTNTLDNLNKIMKDLDFDDKSSEKDESMRNVSNMSIGVAT